MGDIVLIINKPKVVWIPPRFGVFQVAVEQYSNIEQLTHFCSDNCQRVTFVGGRAVSAIYSFVGGVHMSNTLEFSSLHVNGPVHFYFTDEHENI